ncbi:hypothetical protein LARI1_G003867, partial [Lachnellula arida]
SSNMSSNTSIPFHQPLATPDNHGPLINVLAWFLVVASSLTVFTRITTKWLVSHRITIDDGMISISLLLSVGQTVAAGIEVHNGLGQHIDTLLTQQIVSFQKVAYASNILWLASQCFSKLSVIFFIREISPVTFNANTTLGIIISTVTWCAISIIVLVFQCRVPQVWDFLGNTCINREVFWDFTNAFNILLDLSLLLLPFAIVWNLQVPMQRKIVVLGCFASRVLTVAAVIFQMIATNQQINSSDATFDYSIVAISMSISGCLAIVTACIPYLKPFMDGLESGMIRSDDLHRRHGDVSASRVSKYGHGSHYRSPHSLGVNSIHSTNQLELNSINKNGPSTTIASAKALPRQDEIEWDAESHNSRTQIIKQVKTWTVVSRKAGEGQCSEEKDI